jgi:hypothetical protein
VRDLKYVSIYLLQGRLNILNSLDEKVAGIMMMLLWCAIEWKQLKALMPKFERQEQNKKKRERIGTKRDTSPDESVR